MSRPQYNKCYKRGAVPAEKRDSASLFVLCVCVKGRMSVTVKLIELLYTEEGVYAERR